MRRKDREITDLFELEQIISKCKVCRLGLCENNVPYVVPMNFGYELQGGVLTLYFHCANEGKKLDILKNNPTVCFEMDCGHELITGKTACSYSMEYESIIGNGKIEFVGDAQGKITALSKIMNQYTGKTEFAFDDNVVEHLVVLKLTASNFTGKGRN